MDDLSYEGIRNIKALMDEVCKMTDINMDVLELYAEAKEMNDFDLIMESLKQLMTNNTHILTNYTTVISIFMLETDYYGQIEREGLSNE
jgi:putative NADH-flavin reductase